jgi:hypothetical protein
MTLSAQPVAALENLADKRAGKDVGWINIADSRAFAEQVFSYQRVILGLRASGESERPTAVANWPLLHCDPAVGGSSEGCVTELRRERIAVHTNGLVWREAIEPVVSIRCN